MSASGARPTASASSPSYSGAPQSMFGSKEHTRSGRSIIELGGTLAPKATITDADWAAKQQAILDKMRDAHRKQQEWAEKEARIERTLGDADKKDKKAALPKNILERTGMTHKEAKEMSQPAAVSATSGSQSASTLLSGSASTAAVASPPQADPAPRNGSTPTLSDQYWSIGSAPAKRKPTTMEGVARPAPMFYPAQIPSTSSSGYDTEASLS
jgi:hypothetical protein